MTLKSILAAAGLSIAVFAFSPQAANAMPIEPMNGAATPYVEKIYGGCGYNGHRGYYGGCRFGGQRQVYNARRYHYYRHHYRHW